MRTGGVIFRLNASIFADGLARRASSVVICNDDYGVLL